MKKILKVSIFTVILGLMLTACGQNTENESQPLAFEANIQISTLIKEPSLNDSVQTIVLSFNQALDQATIKDGIKLYRIDSLGAQVEEVSKIYLNPNSANKININTANLTSFEQGQEYKLEVSKALKSQTGETLEENYEGYFATNNKFSFKESYDLNKRRSQIVIISDMHLGVDDNFSEINKNKEPLIDFLTEIKSAPNVAEIAIAGDMFDEWFLPMDYQMPNSMSVFYDNIVKNNQRVVDAINNIILEGEIKVTYISGNHDILFNEKDVERIFPGINQVREEVEGLGTYILGDNDEIAIEHGHRYNIFVAPDPISNLNLTNNDKAYLPPGYFFTRIATSSVIQGMPEQKNTFEDLLPNQEDEDQLNYFYYHQVWKALLSRFTVTENFSDNVIKTNLDGFTDDFAINDLLPKQNADGTIEPALFKNIVENWDKRQELNNVTTKISAKEAILGAASNALTDQQAKTQYFDVDASKKIVVFGHTHEAKILEHRNLNDEKVIYANSGAWIDETVSTIYPSKTFVVINKNGENSALQTVNLYQYTNSRDIIQWEDGHAVTTIEDKNLK